MPPTYAEYVRRLARLGPPMAFAGVGFIGLAAVLRGILPGLSASGLILVLQGAGIFLFYRSAGVKPGREPHAYREALAGLTARQHAAYCFGLVAYLGGAGAAVMLTGRSSGMSSVVLVPMLIGGVFLVHAGLSRRVAAEPSCAACGYPVPERGEERPIRCPECGESIAADSGVTRSRRAPSPAMAACGAVLAAGGVLHFVYNLAPGSLGGAMPTGALLRLAPGEERLWSELSSRSLTREQEIELARRLLDARETEPYFGIHPGLAWLQAQWRSGALPPELAERYLDNLRFEWDVPETVRTGEPFRATLAGRKLDLGWGLSRTAFVQGFSVGDDPAPIARGEGRPWSDFLDKDNPGAAVEIVPEEPGELRIRARVVIVYRSAPGPLTLEWHEDGTYTLPANARDPEERVLETTVRVVGPGGG